MSILVTGGAGFIGSNFVLDWLAQSDETVVNLDALTYAGNLANLASLQGDARHVFVQGDIGDRALVDSLLATHRPRAIVHFAAESHVDRSIHGPGAFMKTNVDGTFTLLEAARGYWGTLADTDKAAFRFHHVSTDEVYGSLGPGDPAFTETHPYLPNSPYSASKAASDHLVRAWHHTYGLPVLTTNCSNNYGPYHFPEKLIPLMIVNALAGKPLPVYGDGQQVRDWLSLQRDFSRVPAVRELLIETFPRGGKHYMVCYPFEGRLAHQTLGMLLTRRLERARARPLGFVAHEYALAVWGLGDISHLVRNGKIDFASLFAPDMLGDDLEAWLAESALMKRTFRNCALISGLIPRRFTGEEKSRRQVLFSTDLVYDVLRKHQADHVLLRAARADAATGLLDLKRLGDMLARIQGRITHRELDHVSPLAVPVMLEIGRESVYGEAADELLAEAADELVREAMH